MNECRVGSLDYTLCDIADCLKKASCHRQHMGEKHKELWEKGVHIRCSFLIFEDQAGIDKCDLYWPCIRREEVKKPDVEIAETKVEEPKTSE